jgi:hypothetical protein
LGKYKSERRFLLQDAKIELPENYKPKQNEKIILFLSISFWVVFGHAQRNETKIALVMFAQCAANT